MAGTLRSSTTVPPGWRVWLPAILLVSVAVVQISLSKAADLSPWKGGGFGMFATIDGSAFRHVRIFVEAPERFEELEISPSQQVLSAQASLFPSDSSMQRLAEAVVRREARYGRPVTSVTIEVRRAEFNEHLEATDTELRTFKWNVDGSSDKSR